MKTGDNVRKHVQKVTNLVVNKIISKVLFYHSNCKNPGIAGFAKVRHTCQYEQFQRFTTLQVHKEAYPDRKSFYYAGGGS